MLARGSEQEKVTAPQHFLGFYSERRFRFVHLGDDSGECMMQFFKRGMEHVFLVAEASRMPFANG
jgi:hypothetical protein